MGYQNDRLLAYVDLKTLRETVHLDPLRFDQESLPRSGMPRTWSRHLERKILRFIRKVPKASYPRIQQECDTDLSPSTLYRML
jgi:hypothetical protein